MSAEQHTIYDYIIVGGGIVGLSVAWQLQQRTPDVRLLLIEKENSVAKHQTGRNSGVIHAGVYYRPGSLKAEFCRQGAQATYEFCQQFDVNFERCGKLLVATSSAELERMESLILRCRENGLQPKRLSVDELGELEPNITGKGAFLVGESGIVDYPGMCRQMARLFTQSGGELAFETKLIDINEESSQVTAVTNRGDYRCRYLIACTGLMADRTAHMQGIHPDFRIIPFRGEYYRLKERHSKVVRHLIYPIPDPALPFLGVHLTRMIDGSITIGPSAMLGLKREGYGKLNFNWRDTTDMLTYSGFWKLTSHNLSSAANEIKNAVSKKAYLDLVHRYCPSINRKDLLSWPTGVRAMAVNRDGQMIDDFKFERTARSLHVCNAPSPAATSSIPIGEFICDQVSTVT